jgi:hypothetical protein
MPKEVVRLTAPEDFIPHSRHNVMCYIVEKACKNKLKSVEIILIYCVHPKFSTTEGPDYLEKRQSVPRFAQT